MQRNKGLYDEIGVVAFEIIETFPGDWCTLRITTQKGELIDIHSSYFAEMQKLSFEDDIAKQELESC